MNALRSLLSVPLVKGFQLWRQWRSLLFTSIDHQVVMSNVSEAGGLTPRFAFMAVMSCGIAILGLIQSSGAVVIGAMLISPLMGPIVQLGFSLCVVDFRMMGRALLALLAGLVLALGTAMCIVWLSPLRDATSEILARTQPTLFDLLVALLSGLAGGYAVITRKGETIVGVAIATALMPPLAVVAFGLAIGDRAIASGALFLFMTNLLAIALSVTLIAKWYGFGMENSPRHTAWQAVVIASTFILLAIPLGLALRDIGEQTWTANQTRAVVSTYLASHSASIDQMSVVRSGDGYAVDLVAMVPTYITEAQRELSGRLEARLPKPVSIRIRQTLEANEDGRRNRVDLDGLRLAVNLLSTQTGELRSELDSLAVARVHDLLDGIPARVAADTAHRRMIAELPHSMPDEEVARVRERLHAVVAGWSIDVVVLPSPEPSAPPPPTALLPESTAAQSVDAGGPGRQRGRR
ncbi:DUF389 domain-containing protein [Stenotrophomonas sp.]|uniref:DUF389 domain-containing protein n=1 Tax=Stenotrophomonas sp. TaxID=69392 RepID=UPI002FCA6E9F